MFFLKSGNDLYWDGYKFQANYRKAVLFGGMVGVERDFILAAPIDPGCKLEQMTVDQWGELVGWPKKSPSS
jgi:hypothetical protein